MMLPRKLPIRPDLHLGKYRRERKAEKALKGVLLCLVCRGKGHLASDCPNEPIDDSELGWYFSDERKAMRFGDNSTHSSLLCERCKELKLLSWLKTDPPIEHDQELSEMLDDPRLFRNLGQVGSIVLRDDCQVCRCLFGLIANPSSLSQHVKLVLSWSMYRLEASILINTDSRRAGAKYIAAILDPTDTGLDVEDLVSTRGDGLSVVATGSSTFGRALGGRRLDPNHVDISSIRRWLSTCEKLHPITCTAQVSQSLGAILLIDTHTRQIVPYPSQSCTYLALSYKWGNAKQDIHGAGRPGTVLSSLPRTIEDAMILVTDLGQRYLWVDSVCIDQEDEAQRDKQISIMSAIYQCAYATIVAFSGDSADSGLPRVGQTPTPYRQMSCSIDGTQLVGFGPTLSQLVWVLPWGQRSWTYQEAILSTRCIYVSIYHTYFECNAMTCCETLDETLSSIHQELHDDDYYKRENHYQKMNTGVLRSPLSANMELQENALELYSIYANLYSRRSMTKQWDALNAFSGILQALEKKAYKRGMFWALPKEDMNWALLWDARYGRPRNESFPKWSWLSWRGHIWPGEPKQTAGQPYYPHRYPFDLTMWRRMPLGVETIFHHAYRDMGSSERAKLLKDPLLDSYSMENPGCLTEFRNLDYAEADRLLCVESFMLRFSTQTWILRDDLEDEDYAFYRMKVEDCWISIRVIRTSELYRQPSASRERQFLLLARNIDDDQGCDMISLFLLLLNFKDGLYERASPIRMRLPRRKMWVLKSFNITRARVLLS